MKLQLALVILLLTHLAGCGAIDIIDEEPTSPRTGFARIVIARVGNAVPVVGSAQVEINGKHVAALGARERYVGDIPEGLTMVSVYGFSLIPGRFTIELPLKDKEIYHLRLSNRGDTLVGDVPVNARIIEAAGAFRIGK
jgi:hypothetical protein